MKQTFKDVDLKERLERLLAFTKEQAKKQILEQGYEANAQWSLLLKELIQEQIQNEDSSNTTR
jgi:hypothetical protein